MMISFDFPPWPPRVTTLPGSAPHLTATGVPGYAMSIRHARQPPHARRAGALECLGNGARRRRGFPGLRNYSPRLDGEDDSVPCLAADLGRAGDRRRFAVNVAAASVCDRLGVQLFPLFAQRPPLRFDAWADFAGRRVARGLLVVRFRDAPRQAAKFT